MDSLPTLPPLGQVLPSLGVPTALSSPSLALPLQAPLPPPLPPVVSCRSTGTVHLCVLDGKQQTLPDPFHSPASYAHGCCRADALHPASLHQGREGAHCPRRQAPLPSPGPGRCLLRTSPSWETAGAPPVEVARGAIWQSGGLASPARVQSITLFGPRGHLSLVVLTCMTSAKVQSHWKSPV